MQQDLKIDDSHLAFNSKCSESIEQPPNALYQAVTKNLNNQLCTQHNKQYEYFYQAKLLCEICFTKMLNSRKRLIVGEEMQKLRYLFNLKNIINHPLILLASQQSLLAYPIQIIDLMLKSYQPLFTKKSELSIQKQLLNAFISRIKSRVNALCDSLLGSFERGEEHLASIGLFRDDIKHVSKMYEQQFLELVGQKYVKGDKEQIESMLNEYSINNQNPFDKIFQNLDEVMSHLSQSPVINTQQLVNLYTTITDERLWKCNTIISSRAQNRQQNSELMILNSEEIILQGQYLLQMNQNGLLLSRNQQEIGRLDCTFDSLYHFNRYRLIGVNYDSIQIINYFDRLKVEEIFAIEGCTDILPFDNDIFVISNEKLIRIDLTTRKSFILGNNLKELRYDGRSLNTFTCENEEGKTIRWNLKSNQPYQ